MRPVINRLFRKLDNRIRWLLAFSIVAFLFFISLMIAQQRSQQRARADLYAAYRAIKAVENTHSLVLETESAARGFLVSGDSAYFRALYKIHHQLADSLKTLPLFVRVIDADTVSLLSELVNRKMRYQNAFVKDRTDGSSQNPALVELGAISTENTAAVKGLLSRMLAVEENAVIQKVSDNERKTALGTTLAVYGGVFLFLLSLALLRQLNRYVTLKTEAEGRLQESEHKYRALIENAGVVMFTTDAKGTIGFANNRSIQLTGYTPEELVGQHYGILIDSNWLDTVNNFYLKQIANRVPATHLEFPLRHRRGETVWVEQSAQLLEENGVVYGLQYMAKDITAKKTMELELNRSEQQRKENEYRLLSILDNATAIIFIKDVQGRYVLVNKRFKQMTRLSDEMVIGKTDFDINPRALAEYYQRSDEIIMRTHCVVETEEVLESDEGARTLLLLKFPLLDDNGNIIGISGIATDITDRAQDRIELENALREAREAKHLQDEFLANMSHEIRTPMNGIQGMTSLLLETDLTPDQHEFALMIRHSINNLTAIVNDILDYSNLRAGKIALDRISFNIHDPLDAIKIQFANQVKSRGLAFSITVDKNVPPLITGDPYRLKQVLISLVDNALKFTEKGSIRIHVSLEKSWKNLARIAFAVSDTGIGIPTEKLDTIFDSFTKTTMDASRRYGGAGLGLAISKGLVDLQHGNITIESEEGKGSVFRFTIPYEVPASEMTKEETARLKGDLQGKEVLVVEDNLVNQRLISHVLKRAGCVATITSHGREAVNLLETGRRFDLVIMDLQMPVMDGYETAAYIRNQLALTVPILALTATALKDEQEKSLAVGMNDFLLKPFDFNDLYTRLVNLLFRQESLPVAQTQAMRAEETKMYDLAMLEELDDDESVLDVLTMFLENTPPDLRLLEKSCAAADWTEIKRLAHKIKGAVAIFQAQQLSQLLAAMEENARNSRDSSLLATQVAEMTALFSLLETALTQETVRLRKALENRQDS